MTPKQIVARAICLTILVALGAGTSSSAEPKFTVTVTTDRKSAIYEVGEEAEFIIRVQKDGKFGAKGSLSFEIGDFLESGQKAELPHGVMAIPNGPFRVKVKGRRPEFLRCQVTVTPSGHKPINAVAAAGFSPEKIGLSLPVPDDFDEFWADQKKQLAKVKPEPKLTPVEHADSSVECFDVQVQCLGGAPVSGYFSKPRKTKPKTLPAILWVHGAGVRSSSLGNAVKGAKAGFLSMDINAHGIPNGKPGKFYSDLNAGKLKNYRHAGRKSRDTVYFRGMFLRLVRAIDFLTTQPEWNGQHVVVVGHSQGGGQSLAAGGLDDRVTMIAPGVPAICDHSGQAAGRINGWPKLVPLAPGGTGLVAEPTILQAARYVDAVNFASRCKAEAIMSVGFVDAVCPPSSCYAAYNALKGTKSVINEPLMGHAAPAHIHEAFFKRILEHVKSRPGKP